MTRLALQDLDVRIGAVEVCRQLDLGFEPGQVWGVLGRNGVGKSTLLLTLAGLRKPRAGRVLLNDTPIHALPRRDVAKQLGILLQQDEDPFPATLMDAVLIGRHPHIPAWGWEDDRDRTLALQAIQDVDLAGMQHRALATLSGGERRRVAAAALLTQDPSVMLLDEPTGYLDVQHQVTLLNHFAGLARNHGKTVVMVLHDVNLAARYCDFLLLLYGDGETAMGASAKVLTGDNLSRLYNHPVQYTETPNGRFFYPASMGRVE
jgi:iron complex transport system ATP-binding protein